jgi:Phosphatidylinositol-glycan biosynthesis class S protein
MRRVLSAVALFVFLVAFAPVAYHFIASPSMILPEADRVEALCSQAASKLESKVLSVNRSTLLSVFSQRLLPVRPQGIHFEFYLVNSNPARGIFAWDFGRRVHPALHSSLAAVSRVLDVSVSAHSVLFAKLGGKPIPDHVVVNSVNQTVAILGGAAIKRIVNGNSEWTTGSAVDASGRAVLRFAVIIPDLNIVKHPLYVKNKQGDLRKGFVQSRWGGVTFLQPSDEPQQSVAKELSDSDYSLLIDSVSAQISQFFGFNASAIDAYKPALEIEWTREHLQVCSVSDRSITAT